MVNISKQQARRLYIWWQSGQRRAFMYLFQWHHSQMKGTDSFYPIYPVAIILSINQYNKIISKTVIVLSAFLFVLTLSQVLKVQTLKPPKEPAMDKPIKPVIDIPIEPAVDEFKPIENYEDLGLLYAVGKALQDNKQLNSNSGLSAATYRINFFNDTVYNLTFITDGVETSYQYYSSRQQNWPEVIAAIRFLSEKQPAATNIYKMRYSTDGIKGQNFTVTFDLNGDDGYTNFQAVIAVSANLTSTQKSISVSCQSCPFACVDDRLALQIYKANNKYYLDNLKVVDSTYDLTSFKMITFDLSKKALTVEQTLTPRIKTDKKIVSTISVTPQKFQTSYA